MASARIPRTRGAISVPLRAWEALRLQQAEGLTNAEIAERMGTTRRTVESWFRAINEARRDGAAGTEDLSVTVSHEPRCTGCGGPRDRHPRSECRSCHANRVRESRHRQPERTTLTLMIQRCHNPNHPKYLYWGGRGISVCHEWRGPGGFERFLAHVGPKPTPKHEIDRYPNKDGNYEPGNVRWATRSEQMQNTRRTVVITALGRSLTIDGWAAATGLTRRCIEWRRDQGWTPEEIVGTPRMDPVTAGRRRGSP